MASALLFLKMNGFRLKEELSKVEVQSKYVPKLGETTNEILYNFTMEIASAELILEDCKEWFKENILLSA